MTKRQRVTKQKWDGRFENRVMQLIQFSKSGGSQITDERKALNAIDKEWGGIERLVALWSQQVKAICNSDDKGSARALNAIERFVKFWQTLAETDGQVDFSHVVDHKMFQIMFTMEAFVEAVEQDNVLLLDIVRRIPDFDPNVIVKIAQEFDLTLVTPDTVDAVTVYNK